MGRRGPPKGEGGAPRKEINLDVARRAASIGCTAEEIAALLGVARATFYLNLERDPEFQRIIATRPAPPAVPPCAGCNGSVPMGGPTRC